ncbi:MAG TPA: carbohydrate ABC transporter permease [Anaerolineae bacterium]|jgi:glucose/mannose transport system permease protein|nr:carbohydrate ABC transporter permease [Anaerolineae bacterium]
MTQRLNPMRIGIYLLLILFAGVFLVPVYVLLSSSLKTFTEVQDLSRLWSPPSGLYLESFRSAWFGIPEKGLRGLGPNLLNSIYLTVPATIISSMLGSLNGYVLSKWKFRGANVIFPLMLFGMFIPYQSVLIPLTQTLRAIGLGGTLWGLILVHVVYGIPITTLIFRNYYAEVPTDLIEAARIDGAGILGIYWRVMFPLSLPGFVVVIIWQFTNIWNEFLFAVTLLQKPELQPITVALRNLAGSQIKEWNMVMAGALIAAVPTLLIYVFMGRFFIRGLLAGSVKG